MDQGLLSNRYQIVRPIGTGETTTVLEAWDPLAERRVAIKVPIGQFASDKAFLLRLEREVAALAAFTHPNVATLHAVERGSGGGFVVAELVEGANLRDMLAGRGPMPPVGAAQVTATVCAALAAAHARGIVHGHLTAANVLLSVDGRIKVTDFRVDQAARPIASAPDPGADVRALGRLLAAMLTGREPTDDEPIQLGPGVPPELAAIIAQADNPGQPGHTAAEIGRELHRILASVRQDAATAGQPDRISGPGATNVPATRAAAFAGSAGSVGPAGSAGPAAPADGQAPFPATEPVPSPVAHGVVLSLTRRRRRRRLFIAIGLVAALIAGGAFAAATLPGREPDGTVDRAGQITATPLSTADQATSTGQSQAVTSTSTANSTTTSQAPATTQSTAVAPATPQSTVSASTGNAASPAQRKVPNVVGLRRQQAVDVLTQAGFGVRVLQVTVSNPDLVQRVISQQPAAGQVVPTGSTVTLRVGIIQPTNL
jgi:hypothetical protein